MPTSVSGKAISSRNATTHGLFARDVVLPALGEDPEAYRLFAAEWATQLGPRNLLEQHYVEKIAAASWRLRRFQRWQAQLFEDDTLTEAERLDRLDKAMRHETTLQRQIDTAVKMLRHEAPQLYRQRLREQMQESLLISERECRDDVEVDSLVEVKVMDKLIDLRRQAAEAAAALTDAPLNTNTSETTHEKCGNERPADPCLTSAQPLLPPSPVAAPAHRASAAGLRGGPGVGASSPVPLENGPENCEYERPAFAAHPSRIREYLDPAYPYRPPTYHGPPGRRNRARGVAKGGSL